MGNPGRIRAVLFDFGGVLAEEGFREGLKALGRKHGMAPLEVFKIGRKVAFMGGYTTGAVNEGDYWEAFREKTGIRATDEELRDEILSRFILRPRMVEYAMRVKAAGYVVGILSDQTNWLDELDLKGNFLRHFDHVFVSYKIGKNKADSTVFLDVCKELGLMPEEVLFVDDSPGNVSRARSMGLNVIHFMDIEAFDEDIRALLGLKEAR
jgi:putative hydrolase of the HAD superfamily